MFPEACVERTVEWVDTDASGHQHNSAILRWVEAAEAELFRSLDLPDYFPNAPRVQQVINYKAKLWFGQRITATVKVSALGRTSLTMAFEVRGHSREESDGGASGGGESGGAFDGGASGGAPDGGELAAYGTVTTVHVPNGTATAEPWPEHFVQAIQAAPRS